MKTNSELEEARQLVEWGKLRGLLKPNPKLGEVWDQEFDDLPDDYGDGTIKPEYLHIFEEKA